MLPGLIKVLGGGALASWAVKKLRPYWNQAERERQAREGAPASAQTGAEVGGGAPSRKRAANPLSITPQSLVENPDGQIAEHFLLHIEKILRNNWSDLFKPEECSVEVAGRNTFRITVPIQLNVGQASNLAADLSCVFTDCAIEVFPPPPLQT